MKTHQELIAEATSKAAALASVLEILTSGQQQPAGPGAAKLIGWLSDGVHDIAGLLEKASSMVVPKPTQMRLPDIANPEKDWLNNNSHNSVPQAPAPAPERTSSEVTVYTRRSWTKDDDDALADLSAKGVRHPRIASLLNRTTGAVSARAAILRQNGIMPPLPSKACKWTADEDELLRMAADEHRLKSGAPDFEAVSRLMDHRSYAACNARWHRLRGLDS